MARFLIVDDSMASRWNLKNILKTHGHEIIGEAADGEEAVVKYDELKPDIVTMDITMPKKSGLDALKDILNRDAQANVIMITAIGQEAKILEALTSGAKDYIIKPFDVVKIISAVEDIINESSLHVS